MKITYLIIIAIVVLVLLAVNYQYQQRKAGMPVGTVKICAPDNPNDCQYIDEKLVNAVYTKALSLANADDAETFPIEAAEDLDSNYVFTSADFRIIRDAVAAELAIDTTDCHDVPTSIPALILSLNQCIKAK